MALKAKKEILADKISSLISTKPANFGSDDEAEDTKAKVVEHYEENDHSEDEHRQSKIRTQTVQYLDQLDSRYAGKKISRKDAYSSDISLRTNSSDEDSESDEKTDKINTSRSGTAKTFDHGESDGDDDESVVEEHSEDDDDDDESVVEEQSEDDGDDDRENSSNDAESADDAEANSEKQSDSNDDDDDDDDDDDEEYDIGNPLFRHRGPDLKIKTMSDTNIRADIDKGNCVRSQLKLWEHLLEMRIKLQKCLINGNQMPQYDIYKDFRKAEEFNKRTNEAKGKLTMLLDNMLKLQSSLLKQYPETKDIGTQNRKRKADVRKDEENGAGDPMDEEIPSDTEDEVMDADENVVASEDESVAESTNGVPQKKLKLVDYEKTLAENHKSYSNYRNSVIQKWNEKTRIATGIVNKNANQSTLKQIEFALNDTQKMHKRTQLKRTEYNIAGKVEVEDEDGRRVQEYDPEIYDDNDFYHQLLRDLIEYKSSDVTDPIQLSKQWIQLQNMRSKMKRKIDTRATKGRRIRYNVHNKLVNFLAPITVNDTWTDNAKNELYNSLFGKIKSMNADAE